MSSSRPKHDHLRIIQGNRVTRERRAGRRTALDQDEQITCPQCEAQRGVPTSQFRKVKIAPRRKPDGTIAGGSDAWVCDYCGWML